MEFLNDNWEALASIGGYLLFQYVAPANIANIINIGRLITAISETKRGLSNEKDTNE